MHGCHAHLLAQICGLLWSEKAGQHQSDNPFAMTLELLL
jgi:hypothetical protein